MSVALLFAICSQSKAVERTELQMRNAAIQVLTSNCARGTSDAHPMNVDGNLKELLSMEKLKVYGYDRGGFAVVTKDERYKAVIGYSSSPFTDSVPCGLEWWMETVNDNMLRSIEQTSTMSHLQNHNGVAPLLTTEWGQERPFNDNCTFSNAGRTYQCITGCVATALAQVMNYHKYPMCGSNSISYNIKYNNDFTITFSEDFSQSVYDWDNMLDSYKTYSKNSTTDSHTRAVAKLMKDCGVATKTSFSDKKHGSSSSLSYVESALKDFFCYDSSTKYYNRSNYTKDEWMNMVYDELDNGRPIIYSGMQSSNANSGGHAFILHGYDPTGNVFVNWGWDGQCDGYYDIDLLNPGNDQYGYKQSMVIAVSGNSTVNLYDVTISARGAGSACFSGSNGWEVKNESQSFRVKEGNNTTLRFLPDRGSKIESVKVNGTDVTSNVVGNELKIDNVSDGTTIEVVFAEEATATDSDYNVYITCYATSYSMTQIGTIINKTVGFAITNSGNDNIFITKLVAKDPTTNTILASSTDTSVLGNLGGSSSKSLSFSITKDVTPVFELEYTVGGNEYFYASYQYRILTIESNDYGNVIFAGIPVRTESKKFSVEPGDNVTIELEPDEGCKLTKLMVSSSDVTSSVSGNQYVISSIYANTSVKATFEDTTGNRPSVDGHEYVDLGLKSGKCWSVVNYGAKKPEEAGSYMSSTSISGWGEHWTIPTKDDFQELIDNCEWTWTEKNGMNGFNVKGRNGNTMFLPAAGQRSRLGGVTELGTSAYYLTSSKGVVDTWIFSGNATNRNMYSTYVMMEEYPIRPISTIVKEPYYINYTLTMKAKGNGVAVYGDNSVREKTSTFEVREDSAFSVSFVPDSGYRIKTVKENGSDVTLNISDNRYEINGMSNDTEIEVEFELIPLYTLSYKIGEETFKTIKMEAGATITPEPLPTKEGYTFVGWSEIPKTMPAHDVTVTGAFTVNKYKLTYKVDDVTYKSFDVDYGTVITSESFPTKEGYSFSGWSDIPEKMPAKDVIISGLFTVNKYKLMYVVDDVEYESYFIEYGTEVTSEKEPTKEGYTFAGWSEIPSTMPAHDVTVTGAFTVNKYKLTYMVDEVEYRSYDIEYGKVITSESSPIKEGHTFSGWSEIPETMPAKDVTATGTFTVNKYKLVYMVDYEVYKSFDIEYGSTITPEPAPIKDKYIFSGWSEIPAKMPAQDVTVLGSFSYVPPTAFTITYMVDGEVYKTVNRYEGDYITKEEEPSKEGYTFSGWSWIPSTMPAENISVVGTFKINTYKLTYVVDGLEYKVYDVLYGATINSEGEPTKGGYTFSGWSEIPTKMPASDVTINGAFIVNKYKLTYVVDEEIYKTLEVEYGAPIIPEPIPAKERYVFSGWSEIPATMPAQDVTVAGSFTYVPPTEYTITYIVDGEVYKTMNFYEGESITKEEEPSKEGYTFSGWSWIPSTMPAENMTVAGTFKINTYKLVYLVDGEEYRSYNMEYGTNIIPETEPAKDGYYFSGWSDVPSTMPAHDVTVIGTYVKRQLFVENGITYEVLANNTVAVYDGRSVYGKIEIPETVIHDGMFYIVSSVEEKAFKDNKNLTELTISKYVSSIEAGAFEGCSGLKLIICHLEKPLDIEDQTSSIFIGVDKENCVLCVPDNSVKLYKVATGWRDFKNIVSISYFVGIEGVDLDGQDVRIYDLQGNRLSRLQKGVNIIRLKNGMSKTILLK